MLTDALIIFFLTIEMKNLPSYFLVCFFLFLCQNKVLLASFYVQVDNIPLLKFLGY